MLSVIIITKDEQDRIKTCLESVKWADEIIVVDNGSTDKTLEIAKTYTQNILNLKSEDFSILRNKGFEKAKGEWVLYIDSDERVLDPLKKEIETLISFSEFNAFALSRKNIIFGEEVRFGPYSKDWVIRLLKRTDFESWVGKVHEYPKFKGKLGYAKNPLLHLTHRDVDQFMKKVMDWSKIDAKLRFEANHPKMSGLRFLRIFVSEIINQGINRKGFLNGTIGMIDSILQVFSLYITYARLWEMQQGKSLKKVYDEIDAQLIENGFSY